MDRYSLVDTLVQLNTNNPVDYTGNLNELLINNIRQIKERPNCNLEEIFTEFKLRRDDHRSEYIQYNFRFLRLLGNLLDNSPEEILSVQQNKKLDNVIRNVVGIGVASLLQPRMPYYTELPSEERFPSNEAVEVKYSRLIFSVSELFKCIQSPGLKPIIVTMYFKYILSALYQILYCPVKKPSSIPDKNGFVMTKEFHSKVLADRTYFEEVLDYFSTKILTYIYLRETMILVRDSSPNWLKMSVSSNLNKIIRKPTGVETVITAMLDASGSDNPDDSTKSWKIVDMALRLIIDSRKMPDFKENICKQVSKLPEIKSKSVEYLCPFERVFCLCTKHFYSIERDICTDYFLSRLFRFLNNLCSSKKHFDYGTDVSEEISQTIRLLHMCFCENKLYAPELPPSLLDKYSLILFNLYIVLFDNKQFLKSLEGLKDILIKILTAQNCSKEILDALLFGITTNTISKVRNDIEITASDEIIIIKNVNHTFHYSSSKSGKVLLNLLEGNADLLSSFFAYLLSSLTEQQKYFKNESRKDLLHLEHDLVISEAIERKMAVYELLSTLSDNKRIQKDLSENPKSIVNYMKSVVDKAIESKFHYISDSESDEFQSFFVVLMVLQQLVSSADGKALKVYAILIKPLEMLLDDSSGELKELVADILAFIKEKKVSKNKILEDRELSQFEKALKDICDPLLPVRGHGLMTLAKLVERKDSEAMKKKQYLLNMFQQNLKNEDSFIYLSAIGGLAAMGDVFPDTVINVLCEEYLNIERRSRGDCHEVRMKIGEVLVRITKILGEMAPKYKSVLLNTFLVGAKDDDHLLRASSLSNLGEICRALGYKLGTIVTEVLVCVHAIIATDKAVEARRAAVLVLRQLFVGLQKEMIVFLKDEILPIYRTLKNIYSNDADDVMRLQAQLALEELNENMKEFIFPNPRLHLEKKLITLN